MMRLTPDEIHEIDTRINQKYQQDIDRARADGNEGLIALLAKPQPVESPALATLRIQQQNNFRIGYSPYWYGGRGKR